MTVTLASPPLFVGMRHELTAPPGRSPWFLVLGVALVVLGMVALGSVAVASLATAYVVGWLLIGAGVGEGIGTLWCRDWSGVFHHLLAGVLSVVVGVLFVRLPVDALLVVTMLLASLFLVGGIFKVVAVLAYRFSAWGWPLVSGVVDVVLGVMIWRGWPASAFWVVGTFVGISLVFRGLTWVGLGLSLRGGPRRPAEVTPA